MKQEEDYIRTADIKFLELCAEIDYWKDQANIYKQRYEEANTEMWKQLNERNEDAKKAIGRALTFCLSVQDDENGNLVIPAERRKELAEQYK